MVKKQDGSKKGEAKLLPKFSLFFFDRPRFSALLWLVIAVFGVLSYTTLLKREGFPQINTPYSLVSGAYIVNDPAKVDSDVTKPLSKKIVDVDGVKTVTATAFGNFYTIQIEYDSTITSKDGNARVEQVVKDAKILPAQASALFQPLDFGSPNGKGDDILLSFYANDNNVSTADLVKKAEQAATALKNSGQVSLAESFTVDNPYVFAPGPGGQIQSTQKNFDRFGIRKTDANNFYNSVIIGVKGVQGFDVLKLDKQLQDATKTLSENAEFSGYTATVSYSVAPSITEQISQLQRSLLEGLLAVLIFSALLIAFRASFITVTSMVLVLLTTLGVLYLIGYTLNTITLFSLILALTLIVDDTIIMVEAIDAQRRKSKTARETVMIATKKISRAMIAATSTAILAFSPLLFVGGILGSFVRAIPITIISSLLISLVVALTFIPFMSRGLLLRKKQLGHAEDKESPAHHIETFAAHALAGPLRWGNHHRGRVIGLGLTALIIGFGFVVAAGFIFQKVTFNIFPPSKDTNGLIVSLVFPPGTTIEGAQKIADQADALVGEQLGANLDTASYYNSGTAQKGSLYVNLLSYEKRKVTAPQLKDQLQGAFDGSFTGAKAEVRLQDVGGPASNFTVRIETENREAGLKLANDMKVYLEGTTLTRPSGTTATFKTVSVSTPDAFYRHNGTAYVSVTGEFKDSDTSTLVTLAKNAVEKEFTAEKIASYGLEKSNIVYDYGFEGQNQDSFKTLAIAFPLVLVAIYILLLIEFRSFLQPLLIFMAIPFSLFGITLGLYVTDNAFSFFSMLGFFALLGLSIKNTILLTDYANQARRAGEEPVEAIAQALEQRFRPLLATSVTAMVSLIPLAVTNPFWQGLSVTLIGGLLSSTLLVITVFPYYYLGAEFLRIRTSRLARRILKKA
ncbi:MAG: efflux RND transporter permease subunit [Candidatus Saccharimonadales bacterium]